MTSFNFNCFLKDPTSKYKVTLGVGASIYGVGGDPVQSPAGGDHLNWESDTGHPASAL